jgi:formiminoglutamase
MVHTDTEKCHENIRDAVRMMLRKSPETIPVVLGGDHSVTAPVLEAYDEWW